MAIRMTDQASKATERALASIDAAAERAKDMVERAAAAAREAARGATGRGDAAWRVAREAGAQAADMAGQAYARGGRTARELAKVVEERPLAALLIAAALGYCVAYLLHHRK